MVPSTRMQFNAIFYLFCIPTTVKRNFQRANFLRFRFPFEHNRILGQQQVGRTEVLCTAIEPLTSLKDQPLKSLVEANRSHFAVLSWGNATGKARSAKSRRPEAVSMLRKFLRPTTWFSINPPPRMFTVS